MPTWFLPPDFTFTPDGPLKLGTIISHPKSPTDVLVSPGTDTCPALVFPEVETFLERQHNHSSIHARSFRFNLAARLGELASFSPRINFGKHTVLEYGTVDHEIRSFKTPISRQTIDTLLKLDEVRRHMESGMFGNKPIYVITGHRIAISSFVVSKEVSKNLEVEAAANGPTISVPMELGGGITSNVETTKNVSFETAPGVIFAYRLHVIRKRGYGQTREELFTHKSAFLTEGIADAGALYEIMETTADILEQDEERATLFDTISLGSDHTFIHYDLS
ncbi:hypothetical protein K456DRAFT_1747458 [Colletotrichum gloeosporioides 23]|nr:hypothetical protein K456DRAFT_1747458 [Colletotrichum gloeosporioides 23]